MSNSTRGVKSRQATRDNTARLAILYKALEDQFQALSVLNDIVLDLEKRVSTLEPTKEEA